MSDPVPSPLELNSAPEVAVLAILEQTLEATVSVMCWANPGVLDDERPYWVKRLPSEAVADRVLGLSYSLLRCVRKYRKELLVEQVQRTAQADSASADLDF